MAKSATVKDAMQRIEGLESTLSEILAAITGDSPKVATTEPESEAPSSDSLEGLRASARFTLSDDNFEAVFGKQLAKAKAAAISSGVAHNVVWVEGRGDERRNRRDYALYYSSNRAIPKGSTLMVSCSPKGRVKKHINLGIFAAVAKSV